MATSKLSSSDIVETALEHYRQGRLQDSAKLCEQGLAKDPSNVQLLSLLGMIADQSGYPEAAAGLIRSAIRCNPRAANLRNDLGVICRKLGRQDEAAACYEEAIRLDPNLAEAHHNLGNLLRDRGQPELAVPCYRRALELQPDHAIALNGLGRCLELLGREDEAIQMFHSSVVANHSYAPAYRNLGLLLRKGKKYDQALDCFLRVAELKPESSEAQNEVGIQLLDLNRHAEAEQFFQKAAELAPDSADIHFNLGRTMRMLGRFSDAETCLRRALQITPEVPEFLDELGIVLSKQNKGEQASRCFEKAVEVAPQRSEFLCNLGHELLLQDRFSEARDHLNHALQLKPDFPEAWNNLAASLFADAVISLSQAGLDRAEECLRKALEIQPDYADAHVNLALLKLLCGRFEEGWDEWEWRWRGKEAVLNRYQRPRWRGESLAGLTILLHHEGGFGDTIQFVRYALLLQLLGAHVLVQCQTSLRSLLAGCRGIDLLLGEDDPIPWFDVHAPLLSVPGILGTNTDNIPASIPYILADPDLSARWKVRVNSYRGFKVGIAWQGNPNYKGDRRRSIPLEYFEPLTKIPEVRVFSLQGGFGREQLTTQSTDWDIVDLGLPFADTAAAMMSLDLIITSDTVIAHLAGALGRPVWMALSCTPDWRWFLRRLDSPWYPTMRLFRQPGLRQWPLTFEGIAAELRELVKNARSGRRG